MEWFEIIAALLLLLVAFFDFKDRSIPILILIGLSTVAFYQKALLPTPFANGIFIAVNVAILAIQLLVMIGWFWWRKKTTQFFKEAFGWGDVWILLIAALYFEPYSFVWFLVLSGIISLIYGIILKIITTNKTVLIPFAGIVSILLIICKVYLKL